MCRTVAFIFIVLPLIGCEDGAGPPATPSAPPAATPQTAPDAEALSKLKTSLDSWTFADSPDKFTQDHPDIWFVVVSDTLRQKKLLRYEIGASRPLDSKFTTGEPMHGFEYAVTLVFQTKGGQEAKSRFRFNVHMKRDNDGWTVMGNDA